MVKAALVDDTPRLTAWQERILRMPLELDLALLGGRGSGKSYCILWLIVRAVEQQGSRFRGLYTRATHASLQDFTANALELLTRLYGRGVSWNSQTGLFKFSSGAVLECNQIADASDLSKYLGRSLSFLACDEVGEYANPDLLDRLRASLRAPAGISTRVVLAGNGGSAGHAWCAKRFVFASTPFTPFVEAVSGRKFIYCPSTLDDNEFLSRDEYGRQLEAACASDPELFKAWRFNEWHISRGAYFSTSIDTARNMVAPWDAIPTTHGEKWRTWLAFDFGVARPSVALLFAESPGATVGGQFFPHKSLVIVAEYASNEPGSTIRGMGYGVARLADDIKSMCSRWGVRPDGCGDDAIFAHATGAVTVADEFRRHGVQFYPARKGSRLAGWTKMRALLAAAGSLDQPGLYVSRAATLWWETVPTLPRDPRQPSDVDSRAADDCADACRYGLLRVSREVTAYSMF